MVYNLSAVQSVRSGLNYKLYYTGYFENDITLLDVSFGIYTVRRHLRTKLKLQQVKKMSAENPEKKIQSGKATTKVKLKIRTFPDTHSAVIGTVDSGIQLAYDGFTNEGENISGNSKWYFTHEGNWFWSGGLEDFTDKNRTGVISNRNNQKPNWGVELFHIDQLRPEYTGRGVKVAIIDSGIEIHHPDLLDNIKECADKSYNTATGVSDIMGHGTHCAGIIGASDNNFGVVGIAPESELYICKAINDDYGLHPLYLMNSIIWCLEKKVDIISMSLGLESTNDDLQKVILQAHQNGIILVAAAGNNEAGVILNDLLYPARFNECIAVGATNKQFQFDNITVLSTDIDILAPGADIYSTSIKQKGFYYSESGTSMAAAFISGVIALGIQKLKAKHGIINADYIKKILVESSDKIEFQKDNIEYSFSIVNPSKFISLLKE